MFLCGYWGKGVDVWIFSTPTSVECIQTIFITFVSGKIIKKNVTHSRK